MIHTHELASCGIGATDIITYFDGVAHVVVRDANYGNPRVLHVSPTPEQHATLRLARRLPFLRLIGAALVVMMAVAANAKEIILSNGVTVSDRIVAPVVVVKGIDFATCTDAEFRAWALAYNKQQVADAKVRHEEYLRERGDMTTMDVAGSSAKSNTRQVGVGTGGFGGNGGYLGYGNTTGGSAGGFGGSYYSMGNSTSGSAGGSFGRGQNVTTSFDSSSYKYTQMYPDLNDNGGGPITIINPYCLDYWRTHAPDPSAVPTAP